MDIHRELDEDGAIICVCRAHGLELCHVCCLDFESMNEDQRNERDNRGCAGPSSGGNWLGKLPRGTRVRMEDRSGRVPPTPLIGTIVGTRMAKEGGWGDVLPSYVIKFDSGETDPIPVEDVDEEGGEWSVLS